jgi:hypothetical protein
LPHTFRNPADTSRWQLLGNHLEGCAEHVAELIGNPAALQEEAYFKNEARRKIFRTAPTTAGTVVLVKGFLLHSCRHRLQHRKYAFNEAAHLIIARERGLKVPTVFGYGVGYRWLLPAWAAVIMDFLPYPSMRDDFLSGPDGPKTWALLRRTIPSFRKLYLAGCNHIDFGPHAILMSPEGAESDVLIDFQYAAFLRRPCAKTLAAQLGYFGWAVGTNRKWVGRELLRQWYGEVLEALEIPQSAEILAIIERNAAARRSTSERLKGYSDAN